MGLKTAIGWTEKTWNFITGCWGPGGSPDRPNRCFNGSCYAQRMAQRLQGRFGYPVDDPFRPTIHWDKHDEPYFWQKPRRIFVSSMGDLLGDWVPRDRIQWTITTARELPHHTFLFLTKNPRRYRYFNFPSNCWLGTTITQAADWPRLYYLRGKQGRNKVFVSFEPLLGDVDTSCIWGHGRPCDLMIVGRMTMCKKTEYLPKKPWINFILTQGKKYNIPVFLKDNLIPIVGEDLVRANQELSCPRP